MKLKGKNDIRFLNILLKMKKNTLAVIIPVYNVEKYIESCLKSVLSQSVLPDEIIIINDGSTDGSYQKCVQYARKNKIIKLISRENRGLGYTRNEGIKIVKSQYVMFLDSDDELSLIAIEKLKEIISQCKYDVIYFHEKYVYDNNTIKYKNPYERNNMSYVTINNGLDYFNVTYNKYYDVSACMGIYSRSFLIENKIFFQEGIYYEDNFFSIKAMIYAKELKYFPKELYIHIFHQNSIMQSPFSKKKIEDLYMVAESIFALVKCHMSDLQVEKSKFGDLIWGYYENFYVNAIRFSKYPIDSINKHVITIIEESIQENVEESLGSIAKRIRLISIIDKYRTNNEKCKEINKRLQKLYNKGIEKKFGILQFDNKNIHIAIYGVGENTKKMINAYEKKYGKIKAQISFYTTNGDNKNNKITQLLDDIDYILISSCQYSDEMLAMVNKLKIKAEIINFYSREVEEIQWERWNLD